METPVRALGPPRAKRRSVLACVAFVLSALYIVTPDDADARDLSLLADLVAPAYTAMNFAVICGRHVSRFSQPWGLRGSAIHYAEHVKDEAIASLTYDDAVIVLKGAADAARSTARQELRKLMSTDPQTETAQVGAWCLGYAKDFIVNFIEQHEHLHQAFLLEVERAKR
jgi:hypothetical protein